MDDQHTIRDVAFWNTKLQDCGAELIYWGKDVDGTEASALAEALTINTVVTYVDLKNNRCADEGSIALAKVLNSNTRIKALGLANNRITDEGIKALAEALCNNHVLTHLDLYGNFMKLEGAKAFAEMLQQNNSLSALYLEFNALGDDGVIPILLALCNNTRLTAIHFEYVKVTSASAESIALLLRSNDTLRTLDFHGNRIGDSGVKLIAQGLCENKKITNLRLSLNSISDEGAGALLEALNYNSSLTRLQLRGNDISKKMMGKLESAIEGNIKAKKAARAQATDVGAKAHEIEQDNTTIAKVPGITRESTIKNFDQNNLNAYVSGLEKITEVLLQVHQDKSLLNECFFEFVQSSNIAACEYLLKHTFNVNTKDKLGNSALHLACAKGDMNMACLLMNFNIQMFALNDAGVAGIHLAVCNDHVDLIGQLSGSKGEFVDVKSRDGKTALHFAVETENIDGCKQLLDNFASINTTAFDGWAPLHRAVKTGNVAICALLLASTNDVDINIQLPSGKTVLHLATEAEHEELCQLILESGIAVDILDFTNSSALDIAMAQQCDSICQLFKKYRSVGK